VLAARTDTYGNLVGAKGQPCGNRDAKVLSRWVVPQEELRSCAAANTFHQALTADQTPCSCADVFRKSTSACGGDASFDALAAACVASLPVGPALGRCGCRDALAGKTECGNVTRPVRDFCENPTAVPVAMGVEDGRISRRVQ
jgi:hypothetical protein